MEEVILQRTSFVPNQEEMQIKGEADQSGGDVTNWREASQGLGAEIGELMCGQDRSGGRSLRRSSPTQGRRANGRRRCKRI